MDVSNAFLYGDTFYRQLPKATLAQGADCRMTPQIGVVEVRGVRRFVDRSSPFMDLSQLIDNDLLNSLQHLEMNNTSYIIHC